MRVLHLIDPESPGGGPGTLRLAAEALRRIPGAAHDVLIVGGRRHEALARRCGLVPRGGLRAALNRPALAGGALRAVLEADRRAGRSCDLVHGWTPAAAAAAASATDRPVLATVLARPGPSRRTDAVLRRRAVPLLAGTRSVLEALRGDGADFEHCVLLPPGVDAGAVARDQRALTRDRWGLDATAFAVGLLVEPAGAADGELAIDAAGRARLAKRDVRLVVAPQAMPRGGLRRWLRRLGLAGLLVVDEAAGEPWRVLPGLDAALFAARPSRSGAATTLPLLWAMACGVPVLAAAAAAGAAETVDDDRTGLLFERGGAARGVLRLHDEPELAGRLATAAGAEARKRFGIEAFARRLARAYEQVGAGRRVDPADERPEPDHACSGSSSASAASW